MESLKKVEELMQEMRIESNVQIFKSIINADDMRSINKSSYKAIMRWVRETKRVLAEKTKKNIDRLYPHGMLSKDVWTIASFPNQRFVSKHVWESYLKHINANRDNIVDYFRPA